MISAMPAVAVRRGRGKGKTFGRFGNRQPSSHHSSITSLNRNRSFTKRAAHQSISTISSVQQRFRYRTSTEVDRQRRRFLVYLGTLFLFTGLLLLFIGVGAGISAAQTVGLLLIAMGALLCMIKVFYSEAQATKVVQKVTVNEESEDSADNLTSPAQQTGSNDITPVAEVAEFTALPEQAVSPNQDSGIGNSHQQANNSITPSSVNSVTETQVLIPEGPEKY